MNSIKEYIAIDFIGGPANRFFEYHTATYLAKIWNKEFVFDPLKVSPKGMQHDENFKITDFFECKTFTPEEYHVIIRQFKDGKLNPSWKEDLLKMDIPKGNVFLTDGWYQTFWEGHITIPYLPTTTISFDVNKTIFMHVRRGNYIGTWMDVNLHSYYKKVYRKMERLFRDSTYLICSNDISWCKNNMKYIKNPYFLENTGYKETLWLMSQCRRGAILSNSSFGLWCAYLARINNNFNPSFKVFIPDRWAVNKKWHNSMVGKYIYPPWSEKIKVSRFFFW